jgi:hypothetical protein
VQRTNGCVPLQLCGASTQTGTATVPKNQLLRKPYTVLLMFPELVLTDKKYFVISTVIHNVPVDFEDYLASTGSFPIFFHGIHSPS